MAERTTVTQVTQIGVETTPGTAVAATKRLSGVGIGLNPNVTTRAHRPEGYKYPTVQSLGKDYAEGPVSGTPTYDELVYLLSMILGPAVVTTPDVGGAPTGRKWTFTPSTTAEDASKTVTLEKGSAVRAHRSAHAILREIGLNGNREEVNLTGSLLARAIEDGITLTAGATELPLVPIDPDDVSVYLDTTSAGLGTTKLLRNLAWSWTLGDKVNGLWVVDAAQQSFVTTIEGVPNMRAGLTCEADAQGMALLGNLRNGDTRFLRIEANGRTIGGAITYQLRLDMCVKIGEVANFTDEDNVYALAFTARANHDATWGKALQVAVTNTTAAL